MQVQVFKSVDGIVGLDVTDKGFRVGLVVLQFKQRNGVLGGVAVYTVRPVGVNVRCTIPLGITAEISVVDVVVGFHGFGGVHKLGGTDGIAVSITVLGNHTLTVDVQFQVVVEQ